MPTTIDRPKPAGVPMLTKLLSQSRLRPEASNATPLPDVTVINPAEIAKIDCDHRRCYFVFYEHRGSFQAEYLA